MPLDNLMSRKGSGDPEDELLVLVSIERDDRPGGFCHWAAYAGDLVAPDGFSIGNLKGVGRWVGRSGRVFSSALCVVAAVAAPRSGRG